jgi:uncharacterized protein YecE (DUF72 family)
LPIDHPLTADFVYIRRHGPTLRYCSNYSPKLLQTHAQKIAAWNQSSKEVYPYFNNDASGYAVQNALHLRKVLESCNELESTVSGDGV